MRYCLIHKMTMHLLASVDLCAVQDCICTFIYPKEGIACDCGSAHSQTGSAPLLSGWVTCLCLTVAWVQLPCCFLIYLCGKGVNVPQHACLPAAMLYFMVIIDSLWTVSKPHLNVFFCKSCLGCVVSLQYNNPEAEVNDSSPISYQLPIAS